MTGTTWGTTGSGVSEASRAMECKFNFSEMPQGLASLCTDWASLSFSVRVTKHQCHSVSESLGVSVTLHGPEELSQNHQQENGPRAVGRDTTLLLRNPSNPGQDEMGLDKWTLDECRASVAA